MCVIAHLPPNKRVTKTQLSKLWNSNPDGGGLAVLDPESNTIFTAKSMSFKKYWSQYRELRDGFPQAHTMLHMRIATHGKVDIENAHPFQIDDYTWMAHNGVISACAPAQQDKKEKRSDTRIFVENYLPEIDPLWLDNEILCALIDRFIGSSRLMFLTTHPDLKGQIYKFGSWSKAKDMFFSNQQGANVVELPKPKQYQTSWGHDHRNQYYEQYAPRVPKGAPITQPFMAKLPYPITQKASHMTGEPRWPVDFRVSYTPWVKNFVSSVRPKAQLRTINGDLEVTPQLLVELLAHIRKENNLSPKKFAWNNRSQVLMCWGCDEPVDEQGQCGCFDKFCGDCLELCAKCICPGGWSMNPIPAKVLERMTDPNRQELNEDYPLIDLRDTTRDTAEDEASNTESQLLPVPI